MAIFNIFKKKKRKTKEEPREEKAKREVEPKISPRPTSEVEAPKTKREGKVGEAYRTLKIPHVTEKATDFAGENQYIFKIWPRANKIEIKKSIENLYGVDVVSVKIIRVPRKKRRLGRISGWRKGYKKAIIRIKKGQKIEVLPR